MILEPLSIMRKYNESNKKLFIQSFVSNINDNSSDKKSSFDDSFEVK